MRTPGAAARTLAPSLAAAMAAMAMAVAATSLLTLAACDDRPATMRPPAAATAERTPGRVSLRTRQEREAQRSEEPPAAQSSAAMPRAGEADLDIQEDTVTVLANAAPRRPLLERLAWAFDFALDAPDVGDEPITVNAVRVSLPELLPMLLPDRPYRVSWRFDPVDGGHLVERLEVGLLGTTVGPTDGSPETPPSPSQAAEPLPPRRREPPPLPPQGTELGEWVEILAQLEDPDPAERVDAAESIEPSGDGLGLLIALLANDANAKVRAAAEQLEDSETRLASEALILALQDPDREVVLAAIDALEFSDDESVADEIRPLERHADAAVREAARDAVCFITDCDDDEQ